MLGLNRSSLMHLGRGALKKSQICSVAIIFCSQLANADARMWLRLLVGQMLVTGATNSQTVAHSENTSQSVKQIFGLASCHKDVSTTVAADPDA